VHISINLYEAALLQQARRVNTSETWFEHGLELFRLDALERQLSQVHPDLDDSGRGEAESSGASPTTVHLLGSSGYQMLVQVQ
jgi:hypothetical protein